MEGSLVIGIDAGYANFAWVAIKDGNWRSPERWCNQRLITKYSEEALFEATYHWCQVNKQLLDSATAIVLERQIEKKFAVMNTVIRTLYFDKTTVVCPQTISANFDLPRTRAEKKKESIALVKTMGCRLPAVKKKDDLADAMLLAINFLGAQNPELITGWRLRRCLSL